MRGVGQRCLELGQRTVLARPLEVLQRLLERERPDPLAGAGAGAHPTPLVLLSPSGHAGAGRDRRPAHRRSAQRRGGGRRHGAPAFSADPTDGLRGRCASCPGEPRNRARGVRLDSRAREQPGRCYAGAAANAGGHHSRTSRLTQTACFAPHGLTGLLDWHLLYPIHAVIFSGLARALARHAESAGIIQG